MNSTQTELLVKEIAYRASRRGTKELDAKFKPFTDKIFLEKQSTETLHLIRSLLLETEHNLMHWLVEQDVPLPEKYVTLRTFF